MTPYEIPLTPEPQQFSVDLGAAQYRMRVYWDKFTESWCFDLFDVNGADVLLGSPIVTGTDLLGQYKHLGIGGSLVTQTDHDPDAVPTFDNLGTAGRLYFVVT